MYDFISYALPFIGGNFLRILPLLALTVLLSEWLKRSGLSDRLMPVLRARPVASILVATIIGAVSPLCSCGVIPVIAGFLRSGVPFGPVMAFWIASPSMDPEIFALSAASLGLPLATARLAATGLLAIGAGFAAYFLERKGLIGSFSLRGPAAPAGGREAGPARAEGGAARNAGGAFRPLAPAAGASGALLAKGSAAPKAAAVPCACSVPGSAAGGAAMAVAAPSAESSCGCGTKVLGVQAAELPALAKEAGLEMLKLSGVMLLAFTLEAIVIRLVPPSLVAPFLGSNSAFAVPLATAVGVPLYTTNLVALGLVSGLLQQGMSQGAALAFLIGGAATTIPAMSAVWTLVKPRVFALYLGSIVLGALVAGYVWQALAVIG